MSDPYRSLAVVKGGQKYGLINYVPTLDDHSCHPPGLFHRTCRLISLRRIKHNSLWRCEEFGCGKVFLFYSGFGSGNIFGDWAGRDISYWIEAGGEV